MWCHASTGTSHGPVSVCHKSKCSIETAEQVELVFGMGVSFHSSYTVLKEIWVSPKMRVLPSGTLTLTPDLKILLQYINRRNVLSSHGSRKLDPQSVENWTVFDQPSWQYLWAQTLVPLIYHSISNHHALSTAQLCWVRQIAKAHICLFWSWNLWYHDTVILFQFDYVSQIPVNNRHLFLFKRNVYF